MQVALAVATTQYMQFQLQHIESLTANSVFEFFKLGLTIQNACIPKVCDIRNKYFSTLRLSMAQRDLLLMLLQLGCTGTAKYREDQLICQFIGLDSKSTDYCYILCGLFLCLSVCQASCIFEFLEVYIFSKATTQYLCYQSWISNKSIHLLKYDKLFNCSWSRQFWSGALANLFPKLCSQFFPN